MQNAQLLYSCPKDPPVWKGEGIPIQDGRSAAQFWQDRYAVALLLYDAAMESSHSDREVVRLALLHHAVEQICIGMLRLALGYTPNHFALGYLIDVCSLFTQLPDHAFPRKNAEDLRLFQLLAAHTSLLRHRGRLKMDSADFAILSHRCRNFLQQAAVWASQELEKPENQETDMVIKNSNR